MRIDKRRRHQITRHMSIVSPASASIAGRNGCDASVCDANVRNRSVGQHAALEQGVETHLSPF
jgi:hypothetical protein